MTSAHGGTGAAAEAGVHNPRRSDITDHPNTGKESQNEESVMDYRKESMELHRRVRGKIETATRVAR